MRHAQQPTSTHLLPAAPTHMRSTDTSAAHGPSESHDWQQHPSHRSIKQIQHQHNPSYSQQSFQSMKKNPKIRRNALHAYISYMTYSDLVRTKANSTSHHTYNRQPMTKQHIPAGITEMKTEHHHPSPHQHQPPLTAFLKQYADPQPSIHQSVSTPTTPRPKQVLPSLDHQQQLNYPSPTTSRPQYYQPYPPYSPLHNNSDRRR
ncbi:hypothetical protein BC941DRAFT_408906 [Chlamydoabsidia padenii]|nr:hypothetical protein BC941DRAFT_408906 [Chlamydoabsidia padenii]